MKLYFAEQAWLGGAWQDKVVLAVGADGCWSDVVANASAAQQSTATPLSGPVLPGLVNAHSHAFQRAMAGLTEYRSNDGTASQDDDFWSWRERMYRIANRVTPAQLEAIATWLYSEMLMGGYTHVCEFHYVHGDSDGAPYADPLEMSLALVRAAHAVGIGLTLLPTLYMRAGFGALGLRENQRRFTSTPESILRLVDGINRQVPDAGLVNAGVAVHSLRAVDTPALIALTQAANSTGRAIHIHIAEQTQELADCLAHTGQRPIEWLLAHADVTARWNLVHATHTTAAELKGIKTSGAAIVICPSTEANLGDGVFDLPGFIGVQGTWSIGSDSHVTRSWPEELRLLEYSQRLTIRKRNVGAGLAPATIGHSSTAAALFESALGGGGAATSLPLGGIAVGNRADFLVMNNQSPALLGVPAVYLLDALVFSSPSAGFDQVFVAGQCVVRGGQACGAEPGGDAALRWASNFRRAMGQLW